MSSVVVVEKQSSQIDSFVCEQVDRSITAVAELKSEKNLSFIREVAESLCSTFQQGHKVIIAGNGGSLCDATHFAEEFTGFFSKKRRKALPVIVLSDPGYLTCTANDIGYDWVFARGIEAFGKPGDLFIGLTTSGNSKNLILAFEAARALKLTTVALLGKGGGALRGVADLELIIESAQTSDRIQEAHMTAMHIMIDIVERKLFP